MGNPEADYSNFQEDQADYDVQIQYNVPVYNPAYCDPNPQYYQNAAVNNQQQLQQFQPPPPQQNAQSLTPQFNQPYPPAPPPLPVALLPPQIPQMNPAYPIIGAYPPPQQPYPPQAYPPNLPLPKPYPPPPAYQPPPAAQPVPYPPPAGGGNNEGWRTGLFDCMDDPRNAVMTLFFPWRTFGQVAEIIDNGETDCETGGLMYALITAFTWMPCTYSCTYRSKLRSKFGLEESPAPDWIVHFLFEPCALCQEYRELNHRGLDPSIGWSGNLQKQQQMQQQPQVAMMPPMNQTMMFR